MALTFWSMDTDRDGDRESSINIFSDTKEEALLRFEILLGRPLHGMESISSDEILMSRDEVIEAAEKRKKSIAASKKFQAEMQEREDNRREEEAIRFLKGRGVSAVTRGGHVL